MGLRGRAPGQNTEEREGVREGERERGGREWGRGRYGERVKGRGGGKETGVS